MIGRGSLLIALLLGACPDAGSTNQPKGTCSKAYDKCVLASGVLGVCDPVDCPENQPPPCMVCRSQH